MPLIISIAVLFNIILALRFVAVDSKSPDFCLGPLNMTDCGRSPAPVFYFDEARYTCKIAMWRGCVTQNMFETQTQCNKLCVKGFTVSVTRDSNRCDVSINTKNCSETAQKVFTYDNKEKTCVEADWYGCPTYNKFNDNQTCVDMCHNTVLEWNNKVRSLDINSIKRLETIVEELVHTHDIDNGVDNEDIDDQVNLDSFLLEIQENLPRLKGKYANQVKKSEVTVEN